MSGKIRTAVAVKYPDWADAPFITAAGHGELADQILDAAEKSGVRIIENADLADVLSAQEIGAYIPEETWLVMARIFCFILEAEGRG